MDDDQNKSVRFVERLLANPALKDLFLLQKEAQTFDFLRANQTSLYPTLSQPDFFPGKSQAEIMHLLVAALFETINTALFPLLERIIKNINFSFISFFRQQNASQSDIQESIYAFFKKLFQKPEARRLAAGPLSALEQNLVDKYIDHSFVRREYVFIELFKVQRLKMNIDQVKQFIRTSLLVKPAYAIMLTPQEGGAGDTRGANVNRLFIERSLGVVREQLAMLPDEVLVSSLESNISAEEKTDLAATSRIASILAARALFSKHEMKADRGADTPDKSWFNISRRNARFYGFDVKMLDEFYKIAAETGY